MKTERNNVVAGEMLPENRCSDGKKLNRREIDGKKPATCVNENRREEGRRWRKVAGE